MLFGITSVVLSVMLKLWSVLTDATQGSKKLQSDISSQTTSQPALCIEDVWCLPQEVQSVKKEVDVRYGRSQVEVH